jgi:branched-chain amino acid aminotransferase
MKACVNGRMADEGKAAVSVLDYGLMYGYGLYETVLAVNGRPFRLPAHLKRLRAAAAAISLPLPSDAALGRMVRATLDANRLRDAYVRITVTRGVGEPRLDFPKKAKPTAIVIARRLPAGLEEVRGMGSKVAVSRLTRICSGDMRSGIKSLNLLPIALAKLEAKERGVDDVVRLNERGQVAECSTANIFIVSKGRLITPPTGSGLLAGVTRDAVFEVAERLGIPVEERDMTVALLLRAGEAFKTSSIMGVVPITHIDGKMVGEGGPGPTTVKIIVGYGMLVRKECG